MQDFIECVKCGLEFDINHLNHKGGLRNVCGNCGGTKDIQKHMAIIDASNDYDHNVTILRNPDIIQVELLKQQSDVGTQAHLLLKLVDIDDIDEKDREELSADNE